MKTHLEEPGAYDFAFPRLDTLAAVESTADGVVIRTSRDTFSEERKAAFVRELANEGFIPEHHRWLHSGGGRLSSDVRWVVDPSWWMPGPELRARTSRFVARLIVSAALLWVALMVLLLSRAAS